MKPIALIGAFDTKGNELLYVRGVLESQGLSATLIDVGAMGSSHPVDIASDQIAETAGTSIETLRAKNDRGESVTAMCQGVAKVVRGLFDEDRISGVLSLGGSAGTSMGTAAMRALPLGVPKVMVSTMTSGNIAHYVGQKDILMMYSVVDVAGLNRVSRSVFRNAAGAICGMLKAAESAPSAEDKPVVAASMFGVTTPCVDRAREVLEAAGYEVLVFHATGSGGRAMEALIEDGFVDGVLDVTTTEWCDELVGGVLSAGPARLEAAGKAGVPQVVSFGALDMVNFGPRESVPEKFSDRNFYIHNPEVTLMRTTSEEMGRLGEILAKKVSEATGPTAVFIPRRGVSAIDVEGGPFHDTEADSACFRSFAQTVSEQVAVEDRDEHINTPSFAEAMARRLIEMMEAMK